jgi:hypothetical protein
VLRPRPSLRHSNASTVDDLLQLPYETLHLTLPTSVSSPTAQDLLFFARIDERTRLERQRMNLPRIPPRYQPGLAPADADPVVQAVAERRARQWLKQERFRYFANPSASLVPNASSSGAEKQKVDSDPVV